MHVTLDAVIVAVTDDRPKVLTVSGPAGAVPRLPAGVLREDDRTLEAALRRFVVDETGLDVGYVEQLYTFGDSERQPGGERLLSIAYLALVREAAPSADAAWVDWYDLYPWEDHRAGRPAVIADRIAPTLDAWVAGARSAAERARREERAHVVFGLGGVAWDGVRVLERFELLYETGLLQESPGRGTDAVASLALQGDHRRIVATALGRLRGKLTYRPVVFELLGETFTLSQLQGLVEALSGARLHKPNFRRLVEGAGLVEATGTTAPTGGRPAALYRFRRDVVRERPRPGVGTPWTRG